MSQEPEVIHVLCKGEVSSVGKEPRDDEFISEFRDHGLSAILLPVLRFDFRNLENLKNILVNLNPDSNRYSRNGLILTSSRAIESINRALELVTEEERLKIIRKFDESSIFVVGIKSGRECLDKLGLNYNGASSSSGNSRSLAEFITRLVTNIQLRSDFHLVYPKSSRSDTLIEDALQDISCINLLSITTYDTLPTDDFDHRCIEKLKEADIVCNNVLLNMIFFSPSGLESYINIDEDEFKKKLRLIFGGFDLKIVYSSIGKTTELALLKHNLKVTCVSCEPNPISLVNSILKVFKINEMRNNSDD